MSQVKKKSQRSKDIVKGRNKITKNREGWREKERKREKEIGREGLREEHQEKGNKQQCEILPRS